MARSGLSHIQGKGRDNVGIATAQSREWTESQQQNPVSSTNLGALVLVSGEKSTR